MNYIYLSSSKKKSCCGKEIKSINQSREKRDDWGVRSCMASPVHQKADIFEIDFLSFVNYSQCQCKHITDFRKPMLNLIEFVISRKNGPEAYDSHPFLIDRDSVPLNTCYVTIIYSKQKENKSRVQKREKGSFERDRERKTGIGWQTLCT